MNKYENWMFWLGREGDNEMARDGVIKARNQVIDEALTEVQKLRAHIGYVTWRDVIEALERLKV